MLLELELYVPLRITDEYMGIKNKPETRSITYGSTKATIKQRQEFSSILSFFDLPIVVYTYKAGGNIPTIIYAFKISPDDDIKASQVVDAINRCARISPLHASPRIIKDITMAVDACSSRSSMFRNSVVTVILDRFCGKPMSSTIKHRTAQQKQVCDDLAHLISAGENTNEFVEDLRTFNGPSGTRFEKFFKYVADVLSENGKLEAHSRRHVSTSGDEQAGGVSYIPPCVSVKDLHRQAKDKLMAKGGTDDEVPCLMTLHLAFVPCDETAAVAARYFGTIPIKRGMTKSSGRSEHRDSHYNAKQWQIVKTKMINVRTILEKRSEDSSLDPLVGVLNNNFRVGVGLCGQDDKSNVNTARWGPAARAVPRQSSKAIVSRGVHLQCADHDHSTIDKVIPTVHLYPTPPRNLSDSLYVGHEGGTQLRVSLHSATLEKSDVFHHNYAVLEDLVDRANELLKSEGLPMIDINKLSMHRVGEIAMPLIMIFQADGGPDHNIKFLRSQLAAMAFFLISGCDRIIQFRGCAYESWRNFAERAMSLLNIPLSNCSFAVDFECLEEDEMWFVEQIMKKSGTMNETRKCIDDFNHQLDVTIRIKQRIAERDNEAQEEDPVDHLDDENGTGAANPANHGMELEDDARGDLEDEHENAVANNASDGSVADEGVDVDINADDEVVPDEAVTTESGVGDEGDEVNVDINADDEVVPDEVVTEMATTTLVATTAMATTESGVGDEGDDVAMATTASEVEDGGDDVGNEYGVGYAFERFFRDAGWFKGEVVDVLGKNQVLVVFEEGRQSKHEAIISVDELCRLQEEPKVGVVGFQFVRKFRGNVVFNGRIESMTHKGHFACVYDEDGDRKTYSPKQMAVLKAKAYPDLMDVRELDSCRPSSLEDSGSSDTSTDSDSSDSENETITLLQTRLRNKKRIQDESTGSNSESEESSSSEDESNSSEDESDSSSSEDESDCSYEQEKDKHSSSDDPDSCVDASGTGRATKVDGRLGAQEKQSRAPKQTAQPATNWAYGSWLMGKSLEELQTMTRADVLYLKTMKKSIDIISERMSSMKLGEEDVKMTEYPSEEKAKILHRALREYDPKYDEAIRDKSGQKKMTKIDKFLSCPKHVKMTDYAIEMMLCGEDGCELCPRRPRVKLMNDEALTKEVLGFCPLPRLDSTGETFLPIDECQLQLDKGDTLEDELKDLQKVRDDFDKNDNSQVEKKKRDSKLIKGVNWSKVRYLLGCDYCKATRCVYSRFAIGNKKGPTTKHMTSLKKFVEDNGYKCGDVLRVYADGKTESEREGDDDKDEEPLLFCKEAHVCGTTIESQYYAPEETPSKGGRVPAKHICCHCYTDSHFANKKYVQGKHALSGRGFLPICKDCVDDGAMPVFKKGRPNQVELTREKVQKKRRRRVQVASGQRRVEKWAFLYGVV